MASSLTPPSDWRHRLFYDQEPGPIKTESVVAKPFVCFIVGCERQYQRKGDLKTHIINKHGKRQLAGRAEFRDRSTRDKPYPCVYSNCGTGFLIEKYLLAHLRQKHLVEGKFLCPRPNCGLDFSKSSQLLHHIEDDHKQ